MGVSHDVEEREVGGGVLEPSSAKMSCSVELGNHLLRKIMCYGYIIKVKRKIHEG